MTLELADLSGGVRVSGEKYVAPNGVVVTTTMSQYNNSTYYYLSYLFNGTTQAGVDGAGGYWLARGGQGGYLYMDVSMLKRPITVMRIYPYTRSDTSSNYRIEISRDSVNWDNATELILNSHLVYNVNYTAPGTYKEHELPYAPKYIRIYLTFQGSWGVSLNEIQLFHPKFDGKFLLQKDNTLYRFREYAKEIPATENLVPKMTSDNAPKGIASASSTWDNVNYVAYRAFNRKDTPSITNCWHVHSNARLPQWLAYEFAEPQVIKNFSLTSRIDSGSGESPRDFILQGRKKDSAVWENIKGYTQSNGWAPNTTRYFDCSENNTAYIAYRLYITANTGGLTDTTVIVTLSIASWEMFGEGTPGIENGFETLPINQLNAEFINENGEDLSELGKYNRRVMTLDFLAFDRGREIEVNDVPLKESRIELDLERLFDIRRLN